MKNTTTIDSTAAAGPSMLDHLLVAFVSAVTLLRATCIETPHLEQQAAVIRPELVSLLLSGSLFACAAVWLLRHLTGPAFTWRTTNFGIAAVVFLVAGLLSTLMASNKRAAITDIVTLTAPIAAAMVLAQLLTSRLRIRLLLLCLLAIGAASAVVSVDQFYSSNEALVLDYRADPAAHLQRLNIEPGSLEQWMYEHRLFSKGVRGFLLTGNSTATFLLLVVFAGLGLAVDAFTAARRLTDKRKKDHTLAAAVAYALTTALAAAGILITRSKGGIAALLIGLLLLAALALFGRFIWKRRRLFGIAVLGLLVVTGVLTVVYGMQHDRLPGGNSMLVRWQYWTSAARMIADHPATGVGPGNFSVFYPAYKIPAASETVQDPHSWPLSLLTQYGPLGLLAIAAALALPLYTSLAHRFSASHTEISTGQPPAENRLKWLLFAAVMLLLLFVRPILIDLDFLTADEVQSAVFGYVLLYVVPAAVFAGAFLLLSKAQVADESAWQSSGRGILELSLGAGVIALLIHNLIDFAIFEPGVWGTLWMLIAILIAHVRNRQPRPAPPVLTRPRRIAGITLVCTTAAAGLIWAVLPPFRADALVRRALSSEYGWLINLQKSVVADPLSPDAAARAAALLTPGIRRNGQLDENLLSITLTFAADAHRRNPADFKPLRLIAQIYTAAAEQSSGASKTAYLRQALETYKQAITRYPGSDRMHFEAARAAEDCGDPQAALDHYRAAVKIEDAFRAQFKIMYPDHPDPVSRLGQSAYQTALQKIDELSPKAE